MTKIFGWHSQRDGCYWYRMRLPLDQLASQGHEVTLSSRLSVPEVEDYDIIVGQRLAQGPATALWLRLAREDKHKLVYELDDDFWHIDPTSPVVYEAYQPHILRNMEACISHAHMVTVTTPHLAEVVSKFNPNVVILSNYIPQDLLTLEPDLSVVKYNDGDKVRIGWGGSSTHQMDFDFARDQLIRVLRRNPNALMYFLGAHYPDRFPAGQVRTARWSEDVWDYYNMLTAFDIGIAPLRPHAFNRSKSAIKALEYAALGIPAVVSAEPSYVDFVHHGLTGFLVTHEHEWGKYLGELISNPDLRDAMGRKARDHAAGWTIEGNAYRWSEAYQSLL